MRSVKQSLLVLNGVSNWRDGFVNVVRLATSEPERNPRGGRRNTTSGQGVTGPGLGRDARLEAKTAKETYLGNRRI